MISVLGKQNLKQKGKGTGTAKKLARKYGEF